MGVAIKDILDYDEVELQSISNKTIAIDSFNMLYQFLASIRQPDGSPLTDSKGNITSHLKGLFNRCVYFKRNNIKPIFIFDGIAPKLKEKERELRAEKRALADKKFREAQELGLAEDTKKYAQQLNRLNETMIEESKELILKFGFPVINAPSEGEAQAAFMTNNKIVYASASQDFDSLLFGAKYLIRNLSISNKRKVPGSSVYKDIPIEFYDLEKILKNLNVNQEELIIIAILCGTDFNPGGIKGIGPKKALKLVKEFRDRHEELFKNLDWYEYFDYTWVDVLNTFKKMPIDKEVEPEFKELKKTEVKEYLMTKDFDETMLDRSLNTIKNVKTLDKFF
jgi:flap endonuclease-1